MGQHAIELAHGARLLGIDLTEDQQGQLLAYLTLLNKWRRISRVRNESVDKARPSHGYSIFQKINFLI